MSELQQTPGANRLHIALYGKRNSGKSSLVNALTGQEAALVSSHAGTTTDPVYKAMELHPIGPVQFIDTAGFDDEGELGALRVEKTRAALARTDLAVLVLSGEPDASERAWAETLRQKGIPTVIALNKSDLFPDAEQVADRVEAALRARPVPVSARYGRGLEELRAALVRSMPEGFEAAGIMGGLVSDGDVALLVMPQDTQAPKGRLILPQVQTIRDLLDRKCVTVCATADRLEQALSALGRPPRVIVTDSQCFPEVWAKKPPESLLTSFSVLFAAYKGDIAAFVQGARAVERLTGRSRVLIAEACTHAPLTEDIGRVKIPRLLRRRFGETLAVDTVAGADFPSDLTPYDLVVHCGGCMFNRKYVLSRVESAARQGVPITNYGVLLAHLTGILGQIAGLPQQ